MIRLGSIFGFVFSLALIFAVYMGTAETPGSEAQATAAAGDGCVTEMVALDEGYGVTRTETHIVCSKNAIDKDKAERAKD